MVRVAQFGIALGALGVVLALMGLFPGVTGVEPTVGIGLVQIVMILTGFSVLIAGAFVYAKYTFYAHKHSNLTQQIALRLSLTGLLFGAMAGLADIFGFGSNLRTATSDIFFGPWQAFGLISGFLVASLGVLIYSLSADPDDSKPEN
jgi:hypothetical protein